MSKQANLYGPPGSGKTRKLVGIAESVVRERGPNALGAVTFTRAAAAELKQRLAPLVGAQNHPNLDLVFPHVGTIHSLCFRLMGRPKVITNAQRTEWARAQGDANAHFNAPERVDWFDTYDLGGERNDRSDALSALNIFSMARQRMIPLDEAWSIYAARAADTPPHREKIARMVQSYVDYKRENHVIDFDDMLDGGKDEMLPVEYLLVDEAQDNSALLWDVIHHWRTSIPFTIAAGDPYQAIYQFNGGNPALFRGQPGAWSTIDDSHRLTGDSANFALDVLRVGGYAEDPLLATWAGVGAGTHTDGSVLYLARTGVLVQSLEEDLMLRGVPYAYLSGRKGPLGAEMTQAWRAAQELMDEGSVQARSLAVFAKALKRGTLNAPDQRWIDTVAAEQPERRVEASELPWSNATKVLQDRLPNSNYFARVAKEHGISALIMPPAARVGTIHSAKGREADEVYLVRNWGFLPGTAALDGDPGETCVAYVGSSRHRVALHILDLPSRRGIDYVFPRVVKQSGPPTDD